MRDQGYGRLGDEKGECRPLWPDIKAYVSIGTLRQEPFQAIVGSRRLCFWQFGALSALPHDSPYN